MSLENNFRLVGIVSDIGFDRERDRETAMVGDHLVEIPDDVVLDLHELSSAVVFGHVERRDGENVLVAEDACGLDEFAPSSAKALAEDGTAAVFVGRIGPISEADGRGRFCLHVGLDRLVVDASNDDMVSLATCVGCDVSAQVDILPGPDGRLVLRGWAMADDVM